MIPVPQAGVAAPPPPAALSDRAAEAARVMQATCGGNPQNAEEEINFVCSLQSTNLAHIEADRPGVPTQGCAPGVACDIDNSALVVRVLVSPGTNMDGVPRAVSVEVSGFDKPSAHADVRELVGFGPWRPMTDAPVTPPLMKHGRDRSYELSPGATKRILELAGALRENPEPTTWMLCRIDPKGAADAQPVVVFSTDPAGAFVELFFGGETHAYLRNGAYYGKAGAIAALATGADREETRCRLPGE
jgi:hypothetical protein